MKPRTRAGWEKSSLSGVMMIDEQRLKTSRHKTQKKEKEKASRMLYVRPFAI